MKAIYRDGCLVIGDVFEACANGVVKNNFGDKPTYVEGLQDAIVMLAIDVIKGDISKAYLSGDGKSISIFYTSGVYVYYDGLTFGFEYDNVKCVFSKGKVWINNFYDYLEDKTDRVISRLVNFIYRGKLVVGAEVDFRRVGGDLVASVAGKDLFRFGAYDYKILDDDFIWIRFNGGNVAEVYKWAWDMYNLYFDDFNYAILGTKFSFQGKRLFFNFNIKTAKLTSIEFISRDILFKISLFRTFLRVIYYGEGKFISGYAHYRSSYYDKISNDRRKDAVIRGLLF